MQCGHNAHDLLTPHWELFFSQPLFTSLSFFLTLTNTRTCTLMYAKQIPTAAYCSKKNNNLLHQGQGVQGGREVQAVRAGRAYHLFQRGRRDPACREGRRTKKILGILNYFSVGELIRERGEKQQVCSHTRLCAL